MKLPSRKIASAPVVEGKAPMACDDYRPIGTAGLVRIGRAAVSFLRLSLKSLQPKPHYCGLAVVFSKAITR